VTKIAEQRLLLINKIEAVATHLSREWRFNQRAKEESSDAPEIIGPHGMTIYFEYRGHKPSMVTVSASWPRLEGDHYYRGLSSWGVIGHHENGPSMNFNLKRTPEAIAADLERRFLNSYQRLFMLCLAKRQQVIAHREVVSYKVAALKKVAPLRPNHKGHDPDNPRLHLPYQSENVTSGEVYFNCHESCDIKLSDVPLDIAIQIMGLISPTLDKN